MHILIVEDAPDIAEVVGLSVERAWPGATTTTASSGGEALAAFAAYPADLVILDVAIPPPDGYEVCAQIRAGSAVPILMLTVHDSIGDKVRGFERGADDCLTRPFNQLELIARMRALVRRAGSGPPDNHSPPAKSIRLEPRTRAVIVHDRPTQLTTTEYRLLSFLMQHPGEVLTHQTILEHVWGEGYRHDTHYLKVFIRRLRKKLGDNASRPRYIQTEWGVGYRFSEFALPAREREAGGSR